MFFKYIKIVSERERERERERLRERERELTLGLSNWIEEMIIGTINMD